jgi:uncharacterized protein (UPF0335 family)
MPKDTATFSDGTLGADAQKKLKSLSTRICKLLDDRAAINEDLTEVFKEAKDAGFDTKIMRKAIKVIRTDAEERKAEESMIDTYVHTIQPDLFDKAA